MNETADLLALAGVWGAVAAFLAFRLKRWLARVFVFGVLVAIPFWELPYGYYNFRQQCIEQVRLQVFEAFPSQDSVCLARFDLGLYQSLVQVGFQTIEIMEKSEGAKRVMDDGKISVVPRASLKSAYCLKFSSNNREPWRIHRFDTLIVHSKDERVVARQSVVHWNGTWWQAEASPLLGIGGRCVGDVMAPVVALRRGTA